MRHEEPPLKASRWPHTAARGLALYVAVGALVSLSGWILDVERLTGWDGSGISIQPNATLAAAGAGLAVLLLLAARPRLSLLLGAFVASIGLATIFQYVTGVNLGIDTLLLFDRPWGRVGVIFPGRMGPPGATSWTLLGISVVLASFEKRTARNVAPVIALVTTMISALSIIGYMFGANLLYTIPTLTIIAFQTSTFILAVSLAVIFASAGHGPMVLLGDEGPAGTLVRRVLPGLIALPIILGILRLAGERAGLYDLAFGTAARTIAEIFLLTLLLWWTGNSVRQQTAARETAEKELRYSRERLERDFSDSKLLQELSAEIIHENDVHSMYDRIVDAAREVTGSQFSSLQELEYDATETRGLRLLASRGFTTEATSFWGWVDLGGASSCAEAIRTGERTVVPDISTCAFMAGTGDLKSYLDAGIHSAQSTPLVSRDGRILGMLSTHWSTPHEPTERELRLLDVIARQAADLIERRANEKALAEADRRKDHFLMTLAHELRNPLAPIRTSVDILKRRFTSDPEISRVRDVIDRNSEVMARLLDDLMDVGRIVRDKLQLRPERVEVGELVRSALEACAAIAQQSNHDISAELPPEKIWVTGDPVRLGQVVGNLVNNACRYTEPGGRIRVSVERDGDQVRIFVKDTGIGIPKDKLGSIFELFSQVDESLERSHGGLGIGLHLAKRLVEMHGGEISVTSAGPNQGSTFVVRLPALEASTATAASSRSRDAVATAAPLRVLVVDDNRDGAEMLAALLEIDKHVVELAFDGPSALSAAEAFKPDMVLLDIGLPVMNGFDVCQQIRRHEWGQRMNVVALTGWGQESDKARSAAAGFDAHLVKPVSQEALLRVLASTAERLSSQ